MERPIIFNTENVKTILDGRKTMTRRVVKPQPTLKDGVWIYDHPIKTPVALWVGYINLTWPETHPPNSHLVELCPHGQIGDRLWVRESFFYGSGDYDSRTCVIRYAVDNVEIEYKIPDSFPWDKTCKWCYTKLDGSHPIRPSIFMPRWASRLTLEIIELWAERLQEITDGMARREGVNWVEQDLGLRPFYFKNYKPKFIELWDSLNVKRGYGWENNPWVWVISFRKLDEK